MQFWIKTVGLAILFGSCILLGITEERQLKNQWKLLEEWKAILCYLKPELTWHKTLLPNALRHASEGHMSLLAHFLKTAAEWAERRDGRAFEEIWQEALAQTIPMETLSQEKRRLLEESAAALCVQDTAMQNTLMDQAIFRLEQAAKEAEREYQEKGKLYRRLSVTAGVFLVILMW